MKILVAALIAAFLFMAVCGFGSGVPCDVCGERFPMEQMEFVGCYAVCPDCIAEHEEVSHEG